jgi:hypothetical protein
MLESLKSLWARWKVQVSFVGGVLVVATAFGTCTYNPQEVSEVLDTDEAPAEEVSAEEVSDITTETETTTSDETTTTGE